MLSQLTPLAIGYLTDHVLAERDATFQKVIPILLVILLVNVVNEVIKVIRRLIVEDTATQAEKSARQKATSSLLLAPMSYFRSHLTGNILLPKKQKLRFQLVLQHISLAIRGGAFIGIAGPSGCGKSSLIKVIDKLEQAQGDVRLGGAPIAAITRETLAKNVAIVPQTPFLVADTVYHNICYGMKEDVPLAAVQEAAAKANIAADIEKLPGGYDFLLAEGGANLSGGQRQRIALARIFLQKPRILLLDEATSALDNTSEKHIQAEIEKMKEACGTTVISIAHRLTTLQNCDEILVMEKGRIVQRGTFQKLQEEPGIFRNMAKGLAQ